MDSNTFLRAKNAKSCSESPFLNQPYCSQGLFWFFSPQLRSPSQFKPANLQVLFLAVPLTNWEPATWQLESTVCWRMMARCCCSTPCQLSSCLFLCATDVPHIIVSLSMSVCRQVPLNCGRLKFIPEVCLFQMSV